MSLLDILIYVAAIAFVGGWLIVILDAITGFRLIERIPAQIVTTFGAIHKWAFIAIAVILLAGLVWEFGNSRLGNPTLERDGDREAVEG